MKVSVLLVMAAGLLSWSQPSRSAERVEDLPRGVVGALSCLAAFSIDDASRAPSYRDLRGTDTPLNFRGLTRRQVDDFYARIIIPWQQTRGATRALDGAAEFHGNLIRQSGYDVFRQQLPSCVNMAAEACAIRPSACGPVPRN